jgi:RNA polymerase sigma factor (TIGR02999 family)
LRRDGDPDAVPLVENKRGAPQVDFQFVHVARYEWFVLLEAVAERFDKQVAAILRYNAAMSDVTRILAAIEEGDAQASDRLLPLVYEELRKLAAHRLAQEKAGQTLQPTALVHEAYLRLVDVRQVQHWNSRGHFFAAAADAMRRILIDNARRKRSQKHGGRLQRVDLCDVDVAAPDIPDAWLQLDEAVTELAREDWAAAELAKLRVFAGLSVEDAADLLGISRASGFRHWTYARAWLQARLRDRDRGS